MADAWVYREPDGDADYYRELRAALLPPSPAVRWQPETYSPAAHLARLYPHLLEETAQTAAGGRMRLSFTPPPPPQTRPERRLGWAQTEPRNAVPLRAPSPPRRRAATLDRLRRLLAG